MAYLVLVRHGKSAWNKLHKWTGRVDVGLAEEGFAEAQRAARAIRDIQIHHAHISALKRARETYDEISRTLGLFIEAQSHAALNERDYGIHTGRDKRELKEEMGEAEFRRLRRGWDAAMPEGESLKDVYARVIPYYQAHIAPAIAAEENVLVVAHGSTVRSLIKHIECISDEAISEIEVGNGEVYCYEFGGEGKLTNKTIRAAAADKNSM
jgi:2,3-bisphosphoglycerate-dependent phosphoglycerate mutase